MSFCRFSWHQKMILVLNFPIFSRELVPIYIKSHENEQKLKKCRLKQIQNQHSIVSLGVRQSKSRLLWPLTILLMRVSCVRIKKRTSFRPGNKFNFAKILDTLIGQNIKNCQIFHCVKDASFWGDDGLILGRLSWQTTLTLFVNRLILV